MSRARTMAAFAAAAASGATEAGAISGPTLPGIADAGRTDSAYEQAYRDRLKRRGF